VVLVLVLVLVQALPGCRVTDTDVPDQHCPVSGEYPRVGFERRLLHRGACLD
jgi:hypothetical protein